MPSEAEAFIQEITDSVRPLHIAYTGAMWDAATTGSDEANRREQEAQAALMRFWADAARYQKAAALNEAGAADPVTARTLKRIYLSAAKAQQDEETIEKVTRIEAEVRQHYYNYRPEIDGRRLTDNEIDSILRESDQSEQVCRIWEASKEVGGLVADQVRELARLRNDAAQAQGYRDHFHRSLTLNEIEETMLLTLFEELETATREPFHTLKAQFDQELQERFGLSAGELYPWHFGDRFFQKPPETGDINLDDLFREHDPVALARATYTDMGLEIEDILQRSDLYPREGKNQHAFCLDVDREGDIRTLNNLEASHRWTETLLHELGHAVYDKYIDVELPWLLRTPPHTLSTEAIALMMGGLTHQEDWLAKYLGASEKEARRIALAAAERNRAQRLVFTRWVLVMTNFERALYANPEQDLDTIWWELVERYQSLQRPPNRAAPDWAAKYHVALVPVYYQNYQLGYLVNVQFMERLEEHIGGLVGQDRAGRWLISRVFHSGASMDWTAHVQAVTGETLNPDYFVESVRGGVNDNASAS
jgi:peptidyl-dipeptidase A